VEVEDAFDDVSIGGGTARKPVCDPRRLAPTLKLAEVLLTSTAVHQDHRHEAAAGHEPDDQQPPLELRHQAERIGVGVGFGGHDLRIGAASPRAEASLLPAVGPGAPAYTPPR
jgi:hypothetical protein